MRIMAAVSCPKVRMPIQLALMPITWLLKLMVPA
jgi:hypothetical protein